MSDLSEFESTRQDVLTQRLRNARTAGTVPMWRSTDSDTRAARTVSARASVLYDGSEDLQPAELSTASCVAKTPPAPTEGPTSLATTTSGCATLVCSVALVVLIVYLVKMMAHRSTYNY